MAHDLGSFDYKTIDSRIKSILDERSRLNNTVQIAMPFIKATTTLRNENYIGVGNKGFTLGLHGIPEDVKYEDMYSEKNSTNPLLGYTYQSNGLTKKIYAKDPQDDIYTKANRVFDLQGSLFTYPNNSNFVRIPPPGITSAKIGRIKSGIVLSAQIDINIPSLIQLEALHRTFLVPGLGMILEWGQQFAPYKKNITDTTVSLQNTDITPYLFPWYDPEKLDQILNQLARRQIGYQKILDNYIYPSNGKYAWMFGRIATFDVKGNKDGSYSSTIKIIGPSEDEWAYSIRNTVVPRKDESSNYFCASDTNSVYGYFANTTKGLNFKTLLDRVRAGELSEWKDHVVYFSQGNQSTGEPEVDTQSPNFDERTFADNQEAYFMTWRFFVNVVINHPELGVRAIFKRSISDDEIVKKIGLLRSYVHQLDGESPQSSVGNLKVIKDPRESFVGANKNLRSVDPSVLIIVNDKAADLAKNNPQYNIVTSNSTFLNENDSSRQFKKATVPFEESAKLVSGVDVDEPDRGFLSSGVWINHKAVVRSMLKSDTILRGITKLLDLMNGATMNYWQLTLDIADGSTVENYPEGYAVVDANWRGSSGNAVQKFLNKVHTFNKFARVDAKTNQLIGSELIECSIDLSLPKRLFAQIGTLGLLSPDEIAQISEKEQKVGDPVQKPEEDRVFSPKVADPNNSLATVFGTLVISPKDPNGHDLTIIPLDARGKSTGVCGDSNSQLPAGTGGQGAQVAPISPSETVSSNPDELKKQLDISKAALNTAKCRECKPCVEAEILSEQSAVGSPTPFKIQQWSAAFISYIMKTAGINFPVNGAHMGYAQAIRQNPSRADDRGGWQVLDPKITRVKTGDIAIYTRQDADTNTNNTCTFQTTTSWANCGPSHGDIVFGIAPDQGNKMRVIGGNVPSTVTSKYVDHRNNILSNPRYMVILRPPQNYVSKIITETVKEENAWRTNGWLDNEALETTVRGVEVATQLQKYLNVVGLTLLQQPNTATTAQEPEKSKICTDAQFTRIGGGNSNLGREECRRCKKHTEIVKQATEITQATTESAVRIFSGFRQAFRYVEVFPEAMVATIANSSDKDKANAFGAAPGNLSVTADLTLPGISGLRVGELFWIDRVPAFYKIFGAFQILGIEDSLDNNGWTTKIHSRFYYLGERWKESVTELINRPKFSISDTQRSIGSSGFGVGMDSKTLSIGNISIDILNRYIKK